MVDLADVRYVVDENLLRLGNGIAAIRRDTASFAKPPVEGILPAGMLDTEWIPMVGDRGWVVITCDKRLRTRPFEANLAIEHKLKTVHLYGLGTKTAWDQLVRLTARWPAVENQVQAASEGPWWLSLRSNQSRVLEFEPGAPERA